METILVSCADVRIYFTKILDFLAHVRLGEELGKGMILRWFREIRKSIYVAEEE